MTAPTEVEAPATKVTAAPAPPTPPLRPRRRRARGWWDAIRRPRAPVSAGTRLTITIMATVSLLAAAFLGYALLGSTVQENRDQKVLYSQIRQELAEATAPLGGIIPPGVPVAVLQAPQIGLPQAVVVEGTDSGSLQRGPGHLASSPLPGQAGVSVLFGRAVTFGHPFSRITTLTHLEIFAVSTGQGTFTYRVDRVRHEGDPLPPPLPPGVGRLILVTAEGSGTWGAIAPTHTVYVDATLVGAPQPAPGGRPAAVPVAARPMNGDPAALLPLVFWLQAVLLAALVAVWARHRWGRWQAWMAGVPVLAALLWGVGETATRLLPNLV